MSLWAQGSDAEERFSDANLDILSGNEQLPSKSMSAWQT